MQSTYSAVLSLQKNILDLFLATYFGEHQDLPFSNPGK
jgi:hypothetical protein